MECAYIMTCDYVQERYVIYDIGNDSLVCFDAIGPYCINNFEDAAFFGSYSLADDCINEFIHEKNRHMFKIKKIELKLIAGYIGE